VATVPAVDGEAVVMRLLSNASAMSFYELDLAPNVVNRLNNIIHKPHGIFLVVGPTGSGKTTTLHSILNVLNDAEKSIWAAEDPVEINHKIGFTFSAALRAFLRADPDIILIGEMRDQETAQASIEASNTGHLVLSTLHTNSATESITRLLDMGIDPVNFSDSCLGILAQRLIKTLCSQCKHKVPLTDEKRQNLREWCGAESAHDLSLREETRVYEAVGCEKCGGTGYKGRMGIHELLVMTDELRKLIIAKAPLSDMVAQAQSDGLRFLVQDALVKLLSGNTDFEQVKQLVGAAFGNSTSD
jgi:type II secretory ATPase GspE/PulE/Tfp pilus assembly ATPase PilB-like protein